MYNATIFQVDLQTRQTIGVHLAEVDAAGRIVRSTWLQGTGLEGTEGYEQSLRTSGYGCHLVVDGGRAFRQIVGALIGPFGPPISAREG